jgi:hypothetical protein
MNGIENMEKNKPAIKNTIKLVGIVGLSRLNNYEYNIRERFEKLNHVL